MTPELTTEARAAVLLHERAKRQALVDRLAGDSAWTRFVSMLVAPIAGGAVFVLISSSWVREDFRLTAAVLVSAVTAVFWLSIGLVQVTRRLQALTTIMRMDGVLERFVSGSR